MTDIIVKNGVELRCGYTTGSCATAAATAAVKMLLEAKRVNEEKITLPSGGVAFFSIENITMQEQEVICSVKKDAGDDPDVTNGIEIFAKAFFCGEAKSVTITGGKGVGVVTGKGLQCGVGEAAINPVPRKMIDQNVREILCKHSCDKGIRIEISALNGEEIAKKTFNSRLGIVGGISILGTTGIVEPMSEAALIDTIKVLIDKEKANSKAEDIALITPGNYGRNYCINQLGFDLDKGIKFSNFIGETLDYLGYRGFKRVLLVGHVGKLVKLAGGIMQTHSSVADCRMEIISAHAALNGADKATVMRLMESKVTDEAIEILEEKQICEVVFSSILEKIKFHIDYRTKGKMQVEVIVFSTNDKVIVESQNAELFSQLLQKN